MDRKQSLARKKTERRARRVKGRPPKRPAPLASTPQASTPPLGPVVGKVEPIDLAPAERLDPKLLLRGESDQVGKLFLRLAQVFNDLKSLIATMFWMGERRPAESDPEHHRGEFNGHNAFVTRYVAGIIRELIGLIFKNEELIKGPEIAALTAELTGEHREAWKALTDIAWAGDAELKLKGVYKALKAVRDKVAFHHDDLKVLADGYDRHFAKDPNDERFTRAWVSQGNTMQTTRYFYADAAAIGAVENATGMTQEEWDSLLTGDKRLPGGEDGLAPKVNMALHELIGLFVDARKKG